jgi:hypothetical protein
MYKQKRESYATVTEVINYDNPEYKKVRNYEVCKTQKKFRNDFILVEIQNRGLSYKLVWADLKQYEDFNTVIYQSEN